MHASWAIADAQACMRLACPRRTVGAVLMRALASRWRGALPHGTLANGSATGEGLGGAWCHVPLDCTRSRASLRTANGCQLPYGGTHRTSRSLMRARHLARPLPAPLLFGRSTRNKHVRGPCDCLPFGSAPQFTPNADKEWSLAAALVCRAPPSRGAKPAARRATVPRCHPQACPWDLVAATVGGSRRWASVGAQRAQGSAAGVGDRRRAGLGH